MNNKTCGECKHFRVICDFVTPSTNASECINFEKKPITNREAFFAKRSNEELAGDYTQFWGGNGMWCAVLCSRWCETKAEALQANLAWLDLPAESEGEDEMR